ncbi:YfiH family protein [Psychrobacter sp. PL19]|uniref:polyphenol oxidase family protein n=1 Tax=Psychrobacter sp. PL19 TaxID=2760711 RepID=UPI001AE3ADFF
MTTKPPITLLAQFDDVAIFQTAAYENADFEYADFEHADIESTDIKSNEQKNQQLCQLGRASYGELNLGLHVNDDAAQVLTNRMRLLAAINEQLSAQPLKQQRSPITSLHWVNQVHGKQVYDVDSASFSMHLVDADAMISQQADLGLAIMTADCVPIVLYQPASGQIAAIHAGWQGLACGVIKATVERFMAKGQVMAWIGVSISPVHYEVGNHVADRLLAGCVENQSLTQASIDNFAQIYCIAADTSDYPNTVNNLATNTECVDKTIDNPSVHTPVGADKIKLNLPKLAHDQLVSAGIIVCTDLPVGCSYADRHYYSYRRQTHLQQPATGRMALIIVRSLSV